jgi:hypothetical protein
MECMASLITRAGGREERERIEAVDMRLLRTVKSSITIGSQKWGVYYEWIRIRYRCVQNNYLGCSGNCHTTWLNK